MLIAVNYCFTGNEPGNHLFASQIIKRLVSNCPQYQFLLFTTLDEATDDWEQANMEIQNIPAPRAKLPLGNIIWHRRLQRTMQRQQPDVLINLNPFLAFPSLKSQLLLAEEKQVAYFQHGAGRAKRRLFLMNIRLARQVAVPSLYQQKLLEPFTEPLPKIAVVHAGAEWPALTLGWLEKEQVKEKYAGGKEFFLIQFHPLSIKLLIQVLKAFSLFKKRQQSQLQLLIPLRSIEKVLVFEQKLAAYKYREDVRILPILPADECWKLVASAYAILDPAANAFGRPAILQAFASQTPLIVNNASPAVSFTGADAALVADMESPEALAVQMMLLFKDEHLRSRLIAAGNARLEIFNWDNAARLLQVCLESVIQKS